MCCPCGFLCCASDEFGRCGCDDCPDPRCHAPDAEDHWPPDDVDDDHGPDDDQLPLAALLHAAARFRCEEIA